MATMPVKIEETSSQVLKALLALRADAFKELLAEIDEIRSEMKLLTDELERRGCV